MVQPWSKQFAMSRVRLIKTTGRCSLRADLIRLFHRHMRGGGTDLTAKASRGSRRLRAVMSVAAFVADMVELKVCGVVYSHDDGVNQEGKAISSAVVC